MSTSKLHRLSGMSLFIGGLLAALSLIPMLFIGENSTGILITGAALLRFFSAMLIVTGLPGMYLRQAGNSGIWGLFGYLSTLFYILIAGVSGDTINAFLPPFLAAKAPELVQEPLPTGLQILFMVGSLLCLIGGVILGVTVWRAAIFSRWAGLVLMIGAVLSFLGNFLLPAMVTVGLIMFLGGLARLGLEEWSHRTASQPELRTNNVRT